MKNVKKGTKKAEYLVSGYNYYISRYGERNIYSVYKNPSIYKTRSFHAIEEMYKRMHGTGLTVLGHNCMKYSAAFKAIEDGTEKLFYFTAENAYCVEL